LAGEGVIVGKNTFSSQMVAWDASRRTRTAGTNIMLIEAVERAFHIINHSDQMIADNITAQGISTTRNQVEEIRLKNGWRRRANNEEQLAEMRALTFTTNVPNLLGMWFDYCFLASGGRAFELPSLFPILLFSPTSHLQQRSTLAFL
jgi:hypothetical protein